MAKNKQSNGKHDPHICIAPKETKEKWYKGIGLHGDMVECMGIEFSCEYCHTPQFRRINA